MLWSPPYYSMDFELEEFHRVPVTMAADMNELEDILTLFISFLADQFQELR
jgi:hypothetical protein